MEKVASPLRRDAAANRERLITAALDVFNSDGLDAGVEQIAQRAGVGVGTLYRRFPTKEALIDYLVEELLDGMTERAETARSIPGGHGLEHYVRDLADKLSAYRGCLSRMWGEDNGRDHTELRRRISVLLREAKSAGVMRAEVTRDDITTVVWSLRGIIESAGEDSASTCQRHLDYVFAGMRTDPASR
ncbi:TetR/AcrR family transcriptional regulator [Jatrophihabitans sp.]|uniref:TetR/AcrR family transcriptional regulator n=1 Tax=Jatrophihabitans sp. TaxID=1932789 RepID=UPI0030C706AE|nr:transcriptional regulator, TetR family [Jatrophihabitans sp.]